MNAEIIWICLQYNKYTERKTTIIKTLFYNLQITNAIGGGGGVGGEGGE